MKLAKENATVILSLLFTIALAFASGLHIIPDTAYIILAIGATVTFALAFLKKELETSLKEEIKKSLELYRDISEIDDKDLQSEIYKLARSLSGGEIPPNLAEHRTRSLVKNVTNTIWGSDCRGNKQALLEWWHSNTGTNWYLANVEAARRNVKVERHFFLNKHEVVIADGTWDAEVLKLLKDQADNNIDVRVIWFEELEKHRKELPKDIQKDFAILDGKEVNVSNGQETILYRYPSDRVQYYIEIFEEQREFSSRFQDILSK